MITTATIVTPGRKDDPIAAALRRLADAGISAVEVSRCPDGRCTVCGHQDLPHAA